jgi:plasmid maintenance system killer protein
VLDDRQVAATSERRILPQESGSRRFPVSSTAPKFRLDRLEAATSVKGLAALPGNIFEASKVDRRRRFSVCVNRSVADFL